MKNVIDINTMSLICVPGDWICCSVCDTWNAPDQYQNHQICKSCEDVGEDEHPKIKRSIREKKNCVEYRELLNKRNKIIDSMSSSVPVEELIKSLQSLPVGSRVLIKQHGYYAIGKYAEIFDSPVLELKNDGVEFYSIGCSQHEY